MKRLHIKKVLLKTFLILAVFLAVLGFAVVPGGALCYTIPIPPREDKIVMVEKAKEHEERLGSGFVS